MSIEFKCAGCGNTLRVPDEHAGRQAKCPVCEQLSTVPELPSPVDPTAFGELGGATPNQPTDSRASSPFDETQASPSGVEGSGSPVGGESNTFGNQPQNPYAAPTQNPYEAPAAHSKVWKPHRGGVILTLGIFGLLCCGLLGIPAWMMANEDLEQMERGAMDPTGRGLTTAGKVLGIIALVVMALGVVAQFGLTLVNV